MDTNTINLAEVKHLIAMSDDEAWGYIVEALMQYGDDVEMYYEPGKYLIVLPTSDCFPVMLHCSVHSGRGGDNEPVVFEDTALTHIASSNGQMGSENRAAAYVILEAARSLSLLPVMLFTASEYDTGMEMFLNSEYFEDTKDDIRAVISLGAAGKLGTMFTMTPMPEEFISRFEEAGYRMCEPSIPASINEYTKKTRTAHVVLATGAYPTASYDERLYLAGVHQCLSTVLDVVPNIDTRYLSLVDDTLPAPSDYQGRGTAVFSPAPQQLQLKKPKCLVCGKTRSGRFHYRAQDFVCLVCERKVKKLAGHAWTLFHLLQIRKDLEYERMVTRAANWATKCVVKSALCPKCGSTHVLPSRRAHNEHVCTECNTVHWVAGDVTIFVDGTNVYHTQTGSRKLLSMHPISTDKSMHECSVCGSVSMNPMQTVAVSTVPHKVCDKCFTELIEASNGGE